MEYATSIPKKKYLRRISAIFDRFADRGFVDWRNCGNLESEICEFLDDACKTLSQEGRYADLFEITNNAYIEWSRTDKDDSNGETQEFCSTVQANWQVIYDHGEADMPHDQMLTWFISELENHAVIDFMEDDLYDFLLKNFYSQDELEIKKAFLDRMLQSPDSKYSILVLQEYYVRVLADMKVPIEEIRAFTHRIGGYNMQEILAKIEMEYGNFDTAIDCYKKLIAERPDSYWSNESRKTLIELYKKVGNKDQELAEVSSYLWANVNNEEAFHLYKSYFTADEWPSEREKIFSDARAKNAFTWFAEEGRYDKIMELAETTYGKFLVEEYEKELSTRYPDRCLAVLVKAVEEEASRANKRSHYRSIAHDLKRISKYKDGMKTAIALAHEFAEEYPRRNAMLDELQEFLE